MSNALLSHARDGKFCVDARNVDQAQRIAADAKATGATNEEAARIAGVARRTLQRWLRTNEVFAQAFREADLRARRARVDAVLRVVCTDSIPDLRAVDQRGRQERIIAAIRVA
jgi:transposase-like protein